MAGTWLYVATRKADNTFEIESVHVGVALEHPRIMDLRTTEKEALRVVAQRLMVCAAIDIRKTKEVNKALGDLHEFEERRDGGK